jgi:chromosome partitioning protein
MTDIKTAIIYAVVNQKGGVGKTTTAVNLSSYLAESEKKVLLIDMDSQANATTGTGLQIDRIEKNSYHLLLDPTCIEEVLYPTPFDGLHIIPATADLAGSEVELVNLSDREYRLKQSLATISSYYDYIIIDCPPSLGLLTINSLVAATKVLIPVQCEYFALEGLGGLVQTISRIKQHLNPSLEIGGIVLTMFDGRTGLNRQVMSNTKTHFKELVFDTIVPRNVRLSEAPSHGLPISLYSAHSKGATAYRNLALEVIARG